MRGCAATVLALALAVHAGAARAQQPDADTGYIGGQTQTPEVDACKTPTEVPEAERRARASEHYRRGNTLYTQGDYDGAIAEFVAAYCDAPHWDMLKNIGQSFERKLDFEKAVAYFSRYILELPPDAVEARDQTSFRVDVLSKLEAQVQVATEPPGANVTLTSDTGTVAQGVANDEGKPILVRKGTYEMKVDLPGFEPVTKKIEVKIGRPYSYYFRLDSLTGTLRVLTEPGDARIFVDKKLVGLGNWSNPVPIGDHTITAEANGWESASETVPVTAGGTRSVVLRLGRPPKSGRTQLLVASTIAGMLFGGGALSAVAEQGPLASGLGAAIGLGVGFAGGWFGIPRDISVGHSSYIIDTAWIGALEGAGISALFACDTNLGVESVDTSRCQNVVGGAALAAGIGGVLFGTLTAERFNPDSGDAALLASGGMWGTVSGLLFVAVFENDQRLIAPLGLAGLNLGITAGALLARRLDVTRGHMALIDLCGLGGTIAGVALVDVIQPGDRSDRLPHFALLGMAGGLIAGAYLTRNMDEPKAPPVRSLQPALGSAVDASGHQRPTLGLATRW